MFGFGKPATARERISVKNWCIHYMPVFMLKKDAAISMEYKLKCFFFCTKTKNTLKSKTFIFFTEKFPSNVCPFKVWQKEIGTKCTADGKNHCRCWLSIKKKNWFIFNKTLTGKNACGAQELFDRCLFIDRWIGSLRKCNSCRGWIQE